VNEIVCLLNPDIECVDVNSSLVAGVLVVLVLNTGSFQVTYVMIFQCHKLLCKLLVCEPNCLS